MIIKLTVTCAEVGLVTAWGCMSGKIILWGHSELFSTTLPVASRNLFAVGASPT